MCGADRLTMGEGSCVVRDVTGCAAVPVSGCGLKGLCEAGGLNLISSPSPSHYLNLISSLNPNPSLNLISSLNPGPSLNLISSLNPNPSLNLIFTLNPSPSLNLISSLNPNPSPSPSLKHLCECH